MAASETPKIVFGENDERPIVVPYSKKPKFPVGTKVYLHMNGTREGPYVVATVASGKVTLCLRNGELLRNGEEFDVDYLELS